MKKFYEMEVIQTNVWNVVIEAESAEQASEFFGEYMTEDFGDPVQSKLEYSGEFSETEKPVDWED